VAYSEDYTVSNWVKDSAGTGVAPIVTSNYAPSPDGTQNASRVQFDKGSGTGYSHQSILKDSLTVSSGITTSKSVYLKSNTTESFDLVLYGSSSASGSNVKKITVTPDWQRFDVYGTIPSTTTGISIGLREINVTGLPNTADVLVWGAQLETGSVATSYIPTSGSAVTRAADDLVISGSAFSDFYNTSEGTFYIEGVDRQATGSSHPYIVGQSTSQFFLYKNDGNTLVTNYDGTNILSLGPIVENQLFRAAVSYKTSGSVKSLSFNGTSTVDQPYSGTFAATNILKIGHGYTDVFSGHFRRIIYWPTHSDSL